MVKPHILYEILYREFGEQHWWPIDGVYHQLHQTDPRFEIIVGAILTQNTAWPNVEKALVNLKQRQILDVKEVATIDQEDLRRLIRPSGFFNQKRERLQGFSLYLYTVYHGDLDAFFSRDVHEIRTELLSLPGIGPETADSILLYAGNHPIFVVDAYTKRLCERLPLQTSLSYEDIQHHFQEQLQAQYNHHQLPAVYNELHALIVRLAKQHCKKKSVCETCPLKACCSFYLQLPK